MPQRIFLLLFIIAIFASCTSLDFWGYKNLGNHFFLSEGDGYTYSIVYNDRDNGSEGGTIIIDKHIIRLNYNDHFIMAKRIVYEPFGPGMVTFWLIDKTKIFDFNKKNWKEGVVTGPLDSVALDKYLRQRSIDLNWGNAINLRPPH